MHAITLHNATNLPVPLGHYSHAVSYQGLTYVSGLLPQQRSTNQNVLLAVAEEMIDLLNSLSVVLASANSGKDLILKITIYTTELEAWESIDTACADFFGNHKPARIMLVVPQLRKNMHVQLEAITASCQSAEQ